MEAVITPASQGDRVLASCHQSLITFILGNLVQRCRPCQWHPISRQARSLNVTSAPAGTFGHHGTAPSQTELPRSRDFSNRPQLRSRDGGLRQPVCHVTAPVTKCPAHVTAVDCFYRLTSFGASAEVRQCLLAAGQLCSGAVGVDSPYPVPYPHSPRAPAPSPPQTAPRLR